MQNALQTPARAAAAILAAAALGACGSGDGEPTGPTTRPPAITEAALPGGTVEEPYSESVLVTGGDGQYSWTLVSGQLPPGLAGQVDDLTLDEFLITGTPEEAGVFGFRLRVRDGAGRTDTASFDIVIQPAPEPLAILTPRLPPALAGAIYRVILEASGGDGESFTWSVVEGSLPPGLTLGADGQFQGEPTAPDTATFTVQVGSGGETATREMTLAVVAEQPDRFAITSFPVVDVPPELVDNVREAIARWENAITGDLQAIAIPTGANGFGPDGCFGFGELANGTAVDDMLILVNIDSIDGPFGILGQASPCAVRTSNDLPFIGALTLDEADLVRLTEETTTDIIQHEIGHILGFGTLWDQFGFELLSGGGTQDPRFTGAEAVAAYQDAGGSDSAIPVENQGGDGTRDGHWRESVFDTELLTGFSEPDGVPMLLSRMSIASFADLGYTVNLDAAETTALMARALEGDGRQPGEVGRDIAGGTPILVLDRGRIRPPDPQQ